MKLLQMDNTKVHYTIIVMCSGTVKVDDNIKWYSDLYRGIVFL